MKEKVINIKGLFGETAASMDKGQKLYELLMDLFSKQESVTLDFKDVFVSSHFFNASVSRLLKDYDIKEIQSKMKVEGLDSNGKYLLNLSIGNAIEHYKKLDKS